MPKEKLTQVKTAKELGLCSIEIEGEHFLLQPEVFNLILDISQERDHYLNELSNLILKES